MPRARSLTTVSLLFSLLACPAAEAQAETLLRWKFPTGQKWRVHFTQTSQTETSVRRIPVKMTVEMEMELDWTVDQVNNDGAAEMTQSFTRLRLKMVSANGDTVEYDSATPQETSASAGNIAEALQSLIGSKFFLTMNPRGEILQVKLSEQAEEALEQPPSQRFADFFTQDGIQRMLRQSAPLLPQEAVNPGDRWNQSWEIPSTWGTMRQNNTYTYREQQQRNGSTLAVIGIQSQLQMPDPSTGQATRMIIRSQEQRGTLYFDVEAGRIDQTQLTQKLVSQTAYADSRIEVKSSSTSTMTIRASAEEKVEE